MFGLFNWKKSNKSKRKNKLMNKNQRNSLEGRYQWIKGERTGQLVNYTDMTKKLNKLYIKFDDGSGIFEDMMDQYLIKIESDADIMEFKSIPKTPTVQPKQPIQKHQGGHHVNNGNGVITNSKGEKVEIPPLDNIVPPEVNGNLTPPVNTPPIENNINKQPVKKKEPVDPMFIFFEKLKPREFVPTFNIKIPSKEMFNILAENFDDPEEMKKSLSKYVLMQLTTDPELLDNIQKEIDKLYE